MHQPSDVPSRDSWWTLCLHLCAFGAITVGISACSSDPPTNDSPKEDDRRAKACAVHRTSESCGETTPAQCLTAPPSWTATDYLGQRASSHVEPPYGAPECPDRAIIDIPVASYQPASLWMLQVWAITEIDTEAKCSAISFRSEVWRWMTDGWERWDTILVVGVWNGLGCETAFCLGGKLSDVTMNQRVGSPWHWIDPAGTDRVRIISSVQDESCQAHTLIVAVGDNAL